MRNIVSSLVVGLALVATVVCGAYADDATAPATAPAKTKSDRDFVIKIGLLQTQGNGLGGNQLLLNGGGTQASSVGGNGVNSSTQLTGGIEYEYYPKALGDGGGYAWTITADYVQVQTFQPSFVNGNFFNGNFFNVNNSTQNVTTFPILVNYKWFTPGPTRAYFGAGIGEFVGSLSGVGYQGILGIEATEHINVEMRYMANSGSILQHVFGMDVGYRFK